MDCNMPIMDGYEASKELKYLMMNNKVSRSTIVAVTSNTGNKEKNRCLESGMDYYIQKPLTI